MQPGPHYRITLLNRSSVTRCELPIQAAGLVAGVSRENRTGISPLATEFIFALAISRPVPGTGLQSPETGRQNRRCRDLNWRQRPHVPHLNPRKCKWLQSNSLRNGTGNFWRRNREFSDENREWGNGDQGLKSEFSLLGSL